MRLVIGFAIAFLGALAIHQVANAAAFPGIAGAGESCIRKSVAGATNEAGLKITFEDGHTVEYCIEFSEPEITGAQLLSRSGLPIVTALNGGLGAAVCSIDGQGCNDPGNCFCKCGGGTCAYWAYFQRKNGAWQYSPQGAGMRTVRDGDADAWVWGSGSSSPGAGVDCSEPTATSTPPPTVTPHPTQTATPLPADAADTPPPGDTPAATATVAGVAAPPTPGATAAAQPSPSHTPASGVLGETSGRAPAAAMPSAAGTAVTPGASRTAIASPTPARTPTGAIRVSEAEGHRNEEGQSGGGDWSWSSVGMFGAVALALAAVAGGVVWRRRGAG